MNGSESVVDWNSGRESNGQALLRIVALLFGFALLAERLGSKPAPVRLLVLAILRSAESVAREFVTGQTDAGEIRGQFTYFPAADASCLGAAVGEMSKLSPYFPAGRFGDDIVEATRLARSFRALASALSVLCSIVACTARHPAGGGIGHVGRAGYGLLSALRLPHRRAGFAGLRPDTS